MVFLHRALGQHLLRLKCAAIRYPVKRRNWNFDYAGFEADFMAVYAAGHRFMPQSRPLIQRRPARYSLSALITLQAWLTAGVSTPGQMGCGFPLACGDR